MRLLLVSVPIDFPLAAYSLAAQLDRSSGLEVELIDLDISRLNAYNRKNAEIWRLIARLEELKPDVLAFSVYLWNHLAIRELAGIVRQLYPRLPVLLGGPELASAEVAKPWLEADLAMAAVHGEGEEALVEVLSRWASGHDLEGVSGCTWRGGGEVFTEAPRAALRDLSRLPSPYLGGLLEDHSFTRLDGGPGRYARALLETYRGCYMQCSYCQWGNGTMSRFAFPQRRVLDELSWLIERQVAEVWIIDAMFGFKKAWAKEILLHIIAEKERFGSGSAFVCYHNQDFYDPELFELYREAGMTVEVDLQSTDRSVLDRVGRGKWYTDSFDRHLEAFKEHRVPTSGAADLMIGLPQDRLESFEESVDFLLRRRMRVNLYQTSIIPQTPMGRTLTEDGTVFAPLAPRSVLQNASFSAADIVTARLIGHGVDFFRLFPQTASLLLRCGSTRPGLERPVDLCRSFGERVWQRGELMFGESHTHDAVLIGESELIEDVIRDLCAEAAALPAVLDLFALERAAGDVAPRDVAGRRFGGREVLIQGAELPTRWLEARLRYRREEVVEVGVSHRVDVLIDWLSTETPGENTRPGESLGREKLAATEALATEALASEEYGELLPWQELRTSPLVALVYRKGPRHSSYRLVDREVTHALLERFTGHFTVAECLHNLLGASWANQDLAPVMKTLASLLRAGFVTLDDSLAPFPADDALEGKPVR